MATSTESRLAIDRLMLPKRQPPIISEMISTLEAHYPPDLPPRCSKIPLDSKLPMVAGPKGTIQLFTTNIGEKIYQSSPKLDFDRTDPNCLLMKPRYQPLNDPYVRRHLYMPEVLQRLHRTGLITMDHKVPCTLKEFNEWRLYLRKIYLALEKRKERESDSGTGRQKRGAEAASLFKQKEDHIKEVRKRMQQQLQETTRRYRETIKEEEARVQRLKEEQRAKHAEQQHRQAELDIYGGFSVITQTRRQTEERIRIVKSTKRWMENDERRKSLIDSRNKAREQQRQQKLEENWEKLKSTQQDHLDLESGRLARCDAMRQERILERDKLAKMQMKKQQAIFEKRAEKRRLERERMETECNIRFNERLERHLKMANSKKNGKKRVQKPCPRRMLKSNWDVDNVLRSILSDDEQIRASLHRGRTYVKEEAISEGNAESASVESPSRAESTTSTEKSSPRPNESHYFQTMEDMDSECHSATDSWAGYGDFHGAIYKHEILTDDEPLDTMHSHIDIVNKEVTDAASQLGLQDMQGAIFNPSIFDVAMIDNQSHDMEQTKSALGLGEFHGANFHVNFHDDLPSDCRDMKPGPSIAAMIKELVEKQVILPAHLRYQHELLQDEMRPNTPLPSEELLGQSLKTKKSVGFKCANDTTGIYTYPAAIMEADEEQQEQEGSEQVDAEPTSSDEEEDRFGMMVQGRDSLTKMRGMSMLQVEDNTVPTHLSSMTDNGLDDHTDIVLYDEALSNLDSNSATGSVPSPGSVVSLDSMAILDNISDMHSVASQDNLLTLYTVPIVNVSALDGKEPSVTTLSGMLGKILNDFNHGKLTSHEVRKLMAVAKEIIEGAASLVIGSHSPADSASSHTTGSSSLADAIVRETLGRVQEELFHSYRGQLNQPITMAHHNASVSILSNIIVQKALTLAAGAVIKFSDDVLRKEEPQAANNTVDVSHKQSSIPTLPAIDGATPVQMTPSNISSVSGTSDYIQGVLERIVNDVPSGQVTDTGTGVPRVPQASHSATSSFVHNMLERVVNDMSNGSVTSKHRLPVSRTSSESCTSEYVQDVLQRVRRDIPTSKLSDNQTDLPRAAVTLKSTISSFIQDMMIHMAGKPSTSSEKSLATMTTSSGMITEFVLGTLEQVIKEIQLQTREPSETSLFIESILKQTAMEIRQQSSYGTGHADAGQALLVARSADSQASAMSAYIRETLAAACQEVENQCLDNLEGRSVTSLFAEELVNDTLSNCLHDLRSGTLSQQDIGSLAAAIMQEHGTAQQKEDTSGTQGQAEASSVVSHNSSRTSELVDELIIETLTRIQQNITDGSLSGADLNKLTENVITLGTPTSQESSPRSETSSATAEALVDGTITRLMQELQQQINRQPSKPFDTARPPTPVESAEIIDHIRELLQRIMNGGAVPVLPNIPKTDTRNIGNDKDGPEIHLAVDGKPMDIDTDVVNETLLPISAKITMISKPGYAAPRNSFTSLHNPDISDRPLIDHSSEDAIERSMLQLSSAVLQSGGSKLIADTPKNSLIALMPKNSRHKATPERPHSDVCNEIVQEVSENHMSDESVESDDSYDEGIAVSIHSPAEPNSTNVNLVTATDLNTTQRTESLPEATGADRTLPRQQALHTQNKSKSKHTLKPSRSVDVKTPTSGSPKPNSRTDVKTKTSGSPKPNSRTDMKTKTSASPKPNSRTDVKTKTSGSPKPGARTDMKTNTSGSPKPGARTDVNTKTSGPPKPGSRTDVKTNTSGSPKPGSRTGAQTTTSESSKSNSRTDMKTKTLESPKPNIIKPDENTKACRSQKLSSTANAKGKTTNSVSKPPSGKMIGLTNSSVCVGSSSSASTARSCASKKDVSTTSMSNSYCREQLAEKNICPSVEFQVARYQVETVRSSPEVPVEKPLEDNKTQSSTMLYHQRKDTSTVVTLIGSPTSQKDEVNVSTSKKSIASLPASCSGKTVEMTSSGTYQRMGETALDTKKTLSGVKSKSSHKSMSMTLRPSSAFGQDGGKRPGKKSSCTSATVKEVCVKEMPAPSQALVSPARRSASRGSPTEGMPAPSQAMVSPARRSASRSSLEASSQAEDDGKH